MSDWLNKAKARISDASQNPAQFTEMLVDQLRNYNAGVNPVVAGGELIGRPYSAEEQFDKDINLATALGPGVVKNKGGNWFPESFSKFKNYDGVLGVDPRVREWADKIIPNYLRGQLGTPEDPVRMLAEKGITHMPDADRVFPLKKPVRASRVEAGFPPAGMAKTPVGKNWENRADAQIASTNVGRLKEIEGILARDSVPNSSLAFNAGLNAGEIDLMHTIASLRRGSPGSLDFLGKLPDEQTMYHTSHPEWQAYESSRQLGIPTLLESMTTGVNEGSITPKQLQSGSFNMEAAVRHAHALRERSRKVAEDYVIHSEYPDSGHRIVQLDKPGQFNAESDAMGHSVRGYEPTYVGGPGAYGLGGYEAIKSGTAKVYSVRDVKGKPLATIEVSDPGEGKPKTVTQIKGRFNRKPSAEAIPIIQSFIKGGGFGEVNDIKNADMRRVGGEFFADSELGGG